MKNPIDSNHILNIMTHETPNPTQATAKIAANTANNLDIPSKITTKRSGPTHNGFKDSERKAPAILKSQKII